MPAGEPDDRVASRILAASFPRPGPLIETATTTPLAADDHRPTPVPGRRVRRSFNT